MNKFRIKDRVTIKTFDKIPTHWNSNGFMDKYMGNTYEICRILDKSNITFYTLMENGIELNHNGFKWIFTESDFIPVDEKPTIIYNGNKGKIGCPMGIQTKEVFFKLYISKEISPFNFLNEVKKYLSDVLLKYRLEIKKDKVFNDNKNELIVVFLYIKKEDGFNLFNIKVLEKYMNELIKRVEN